MPGGGGNVHSFVPFHHEKLQTCYSFFSQTPGFSGQEMHNLNHTNVSGKKTIQAEQSIMIFQIANWMYNTKSSKLLFFFLRFVHIANCAFAVLLLLPQKGWNRVHRFPRFANNSLMLILPYWRWILHHKHTVPMLTIHIFKNHLNVIHLDESK